MKPCTHVLTTTNSSTNYESPKAQSIELWCTSFLCRSHLTMTTRLALYLQSLSQPVRQKSSIINEPDAYLAATSAGRNICHMIPEAQAKSRVASLADAAILLPELA
eukprot:c12349_g2_i1 orf=361-678(-)